MTIRMTDPEPLARCQRIFGGSFWGPFWDQPSAIAVHRKPRWGWKISSWRNISDVTAAILPYLSPRRRAQIERVMARRPAILRGELNCLAEPAPTESGYFKHRVRGEEPCESCKESHRLYVRMRNKVTPGNERPAHKGKHSGPRRTTILVCDQPITASVLGIRRHQALGVPNCERCLQCAALYQNHKTLRTRI